MITVGKWTNTTELFIPKPCPGGGIIDVVATGTLYQCLLPDISELTRYGHTQDEFMVCGGINHQYDCKTLNHQSGFWGLSYTWKETPRVDHVSWKSPAAPPAPAPSPAGGGVFLMGGEGNIAYVAKTTSFLPTPQGSPVVPGFGLENASV